MCALRHDSPYQLLVATILSAQTHRREREQGHAGPLRAVPDARRPRRRGPGGARAARPLDRLLPIQGEEPDRHGPDARGALRRRDPDRRSTTSSHCPASAARRATSCVRSRSGCPVYRSTRTWAALAPVEAHDRGRPGEDRARPQRSRARPRSGARSRCASSSTAVSVCDARTSALRRLCAQRHLSVRVQASERPAGSEHRQVKGRVRQVRSSLPRESVARSRARRAVDQRAFGAEQVGGDRGVGRTVVVARRAATTRCRELLDLGTRASTARRGRIRCSRRQPISRGCSRGHGYDPGVPCSSVSTFAALPATPQATTGAVALAPPPPGRRAGRGRTRDHRRRPRPRRRRAARADRALRRLRDRRAARSARRGAGRARGVRRPSCAPRSKLRRRRDPRVPRGAAARPVRARRATGIRLRELARPRRPGRSATCPVGAPRTRRPC